MKQEELSLIKEKVAKKIDAVRLHMEQISRFVHSNPRLGYQKDKASKRPAEGLQGIGYEVEIPVA